MGGDWRRGVAHGRRGRRLVVAAVLLGALAAPDAQAAATDLTLTPASIEAGGAKPLEVVAVLRNSTTRPLRARLTWTNELGAVIRVRGGNARPAVLAPGGDYAWTVLVRAGAKARSGTIVFLATGVAGGARPGAVA